MVENARGETDRERVHHLVVIKQTLMIDNRQLGGKIHHNRIEFESVKMTDAETIDSRSFKSVLFLKLK